MKTNITTLVADCFALVHGNPASKPMSGVLPVIDKALLPKG